MSEYAEKKIWVNICNKRILIFTDFDKAVKDYEKYGGYSGMYEVSFSVNHSYYGNDYIPVEISEIDKGSIYKRLYELLKEATDIKKSGKSKGKKGD